MWDGAQCMLMAIHVERFYEEAFPIPLGTEAQLPILAYPGILDAVFDACDDQTLKRIMRVCRAFLARSTARLYIEIDVGTGEDGYSSDDFASDPLGDQHEYGWGVTDAELKGFSRVLRAKLARTQVLRLKLHRKKGCQVEEMRLARVELPRLSMVVHTAGEYYYRTQAAAEMDYMRGDLQNWWNEDPKPCGPEYICSIEPLTTVRHVAFVDGYLQDLVNLLRASNDGSRE